MFFCHEINGELQNSFALSLPKIKIETPNYGFTIAQNSLNTKRTCEIVFIKKIQVHKNNHLIVNN